MASSYSHQPDRVKVWVVVWPSTSKVTVNSAPISGSTPSNSSTWVSVAASSVPSAGRLPSTGSQYIQWASLASHQLTSTWDLLKGASIGIPRYRRSPHWSMRGSSFSSWACSSVRYLNPPWEKPPTWRKLLCWKPSLMDRAMVNRDVNSTAVRAMAAMAMRLRVRLACKLFQARWRIHLPLETFMVLTSLPCHDPAIFDANDSVGKLGDFLVVCNHDHGL